MNPETTRGKALFPSFAAYCKCGGAMTGEIGPASPTDILDIFWRIHRGGRHGEATQKEAAAARRRQDRAALTEGGNPR